MLLVAEWDDGEEPELEEIADPTIENPSESNLSAPKFLRI